MLYAAGYILTSIFISADSAAPIDTTHVRGRRTDFAAVGRLVHDIKSVDFRNSLNQTLAQNGFFIRQYGFTGIGSISRRGADPSQVQVLWNGMVVNNPMLGMADLGIFYFQTGQSVRFIEGANASLYGSGNAGGTLSLSDEAPDTGFSAQVSGLYGNFNRKSLQAGVSFRKKSAYISASAGISDALNNFRYKIPSESGTVYSMQGAATSGHFFKSSGGLIWKKLQFNVNVETQYNERNLGTMAGATNQIGNQADNNLRAVGELRYSAKKIRVVQRTGYFKDQILYSPYMAHIGYVSRSGSWQSQTEFWFRIARFNAVTGIDLMAAKAATQSYSQLGYLHFPAQFVNVQYAKEKLKAGASFRYEYKENKPVAGIFAEHQILKNTILKVNAGSTFRRPTLNDLYWSPGGNAALKAETGTTAEAGIQRSVKQRNASAVIHVQGWLRNLKSPIIWLPDNNIWKAKNLEETRSHGVQIKSEYTFALRKLTSRVQLNIDWTRSVSLLENSWYRQLFVPQWGGNLYYELNRKEQSVYVNVVYTGSRYVTTDNTEEMPSYTLLNAGFRTVFSVKKIKGCAGINAENLTASVYQVMPGRPMPMRTFNVFLNIKI